MQVLLQHHALTEQLRCIGPGQQGLECVDTVDNCLAAPSAGMHGLQTNRPATEQAPGSVPRILQREHAETLKNNVAHALAKQRRPALRRRGIRA